METSQRVAATPRSEPLSRIAPRDMARYGCPPCLQPGHGDPERGARDVVKADLVEEVDRIRVTTVLAADPAVQVVTSGAALLHRNAHEFTNTLSVDGLER